MSRLKVCDICGKDLPRIRYMGYQPMSDTYHARREGGSPSIFVEDQDGNLWEKYHIEIKEGERNE